MKLETQTGYLLSKTTVYEAVKIYIGIHALASAANSLAAAGASHLSVGVQIALPPYGYKSKIHTIEKMIKSTCHERKIELLEVKGTRNPAIHFPMVTVTGIAEAAGDTLRSRSALEPGGEIVLTKWAGMDGMLQIVQERELELKKRFCRHSLNQILSYVRENLFAQREIGIARAQGASAIYQIAEGGILAALWNLAKEASSGISVDKGRISILQETIEVCEHYRLNPYHFCFRREPADRDG